MKQLQVILGGLLILSASFMLQGHSKGGDHYRIFLNNKMVLEQFVLNRSTDPTLSLTGANENDRMIVHYSHCGKAGSARTIRIKNNKGEILKEWKFPDTRQTGMQLTVKEIKSLTRDGSISLYYASKELNAGMQLTKLEWN